MEQYAGDSSSIKLASQQGRGYCYYQTVVLSLNIKALARTVIVLPSLYVFSRVWLSLSLFRVLDEYSNTSTVLVYYWLPA